MSPVAAECTSAASAPAPVVGVPAAVRVVDEALAVDPPDAVLVLELEEDPHPAVARTPTAAQASDSFLQIGMRESVPQAA